MTRKAILSKSKNGRNKYKVVVTDRLGTRSLNFGAAGYSDYTKHKDAGRKKRYLNRHREKENWTSSGIKTSGFWSRWLLWGEPTLKESIKKTSDRFRIKIIRQ